MTIKRYPISSSVVPWLALNQILSRSTRVIRAMGKLNILEAKATIRWKLPSGGMSKIAKRFKANNLSASVLLTSLFMGSCYFTVFRFRLGQLDGWAADWPPISGKCIEDN